MAEMSRLWSPCKISRNSTNPSFQAMFEVLQRSWHLGDQATRDQKDTRQRRAIAALSVGPAVCWRVVLVDAQHRAAQSLSRDDARNLAWSAVKAA